MVKHSQSRLAKLPMLEWILVIGFFAVISVFIIQLFLSANMLQSRAKDEGKAIMMSESIAETIKAAEGFEDAKKDLNFLEASKMEKIKENINLSGSKVIGEKEEMYMLCFDKNWEESDTEVMYSAIVLPSTNKELGEQMEEYQVYVFRLQGYASLYHQKEQEGLYHLSFSKYRKE